MSWIRRNWPDLLIVLFILALIAGFVVVLMGGAGSLFGNRNTTPSSSAVETSSNPPAAAAPEQVAPIQEGIPAAPGTQQSTPEQPFPTPEPDSSGTTSNNAAPSASGTEKPTSPDSSSPSSETATVKPKAIPAVPIIPAQPNSSEPDSNTSAPTPTPATPSAPVVEAAPVRPAPQPAPVEPPTVQTEPVRPIPPRVVQPAPEPRRPQVSTPRVQASGRGIPTKSNFRISAGLYSSASSAQAVADKISGLGYPVYVLPSKDDTQVVLVGPFGSRGDANTASGDISRVHQNLFVYAPSSESTSSTSSNSETAPQPPSNEANTPARSSSPQAQEGSTPSTGTSYLQVGAYSTQSGADKLVETLRSSGYSPSTRVGSSGLIRVLVGPFSSGELDAVKGKLSSEGVDSFTVRSN